MVSPTQDFETSLDVANRACQHLGVSRLTSFSDDTKQASELAFAIDKVRKAELRRNTWRFATKRAVMRQLDVNSLLYVPEIWNVGNTYFSGAIVDDGTGIFWTTEINVGSTVGSTPGVGSDWVPYSGPLSVSLFNDTQTNGSGQNTAYFAGELVYTTNGKGLIEIYAARVTGTGDDPRVGATWSATTSYLQDAVVFYNGFYYLSLFNQNLGNVPTQYTLWNANTAYTTGATVASYVDGRVYVAVANSTGVEPSSDTNNAFWVYNNVLNPWTSSFKFHLGSDNWVKLNGTVKPININWPIGTGPLSDSATRNICMLPYNFLRQCANDPRAGATNYLGAPSGLIYNDHIIEDKYVITRDVDPVLIRFVTNFQHVPDMDAMFCEGWAARLAFETCETITQANGKLQAIASAYKKSIEEARTVNGIETGPVEPEVDDFIACRI